MSALVFFIIANPDTFRLMRRVFGSWVSSPTGCPSTKGLFLHTVVFMLVTWGMMNVNREDYEPTVGPAPQEESDDEEDSDDEEESDDEEDSDDEDEDEVATIGPSPKAIGPSPVVPRMADVELPKPGMKEKKIELRDSGKMFTPMDINMDMDTPAPIDFGNKKSVTCNCTDGRNVVINP